MPELTPEEMFNQMMEDQAKTIAARQLAERQMQPQTNPDQTPKVIPQGRPGEPPVLDAKEQVVLNELQSKPVAVTGSHPSQVSSALPQCPDCGMFHPPVRPGEKCGNASTQVGDANVVDLDMEINKYLVSLKNIAVSQIQSKKIKNLNKLLQYMTIEMTKILEGYNE